MLSYVCLNKIKKQKQTMNLLSICLQSALCANFLDVLRLALLLGSFTPSQYLWALISALNQAMWLCWKNHTLVLSPGHCGWLKASPLLWDILTYSEVLTKGLMALKRRDYNLPILKTPLISFLSSHLSCSIMSDTASKHHHPVSPVHTLPVSHPS